VDIDQIKSSPFFSDLEENEVRAIATWATDMTVPEGKELVKEGEDFSVDVYVIQEGTAKVVRGGEEIATLGPGDFFGEEGTLEDKKRSASVVATSPMRLVVLDHWALDRLENDAPGAMERIRETMQKRRESR
jgi:CRP-like cAMP-binding protein